MFGSREGDLHALLHRKPPSAWSQFLTRPIHFLARKLYTWRRQLPPSSAEPSSSPITVVCVSDTHNSQPVLPEGDILIHAGDLTQSGSLAEIQETVNWMNRQPHRFKVAIAGNHELVLDTSYSYSYPACTSASTKHEIVWGNVIYLQDSSTTLHVAHDRCIKIYGSPWTRKNGNWAFQYPRTTSATTPETTEDLWRGTIPPDTDILVTHQPPRGHLDLNVFGCRFLLDELWRLERKPRLHVFGHVHEGHGAERVRFDKTQRAYDDLMLEGDASVLRRLYLLCLLFLFTALQYCWWVGRVDETTTTTWFVNAAIVGGLRDEKRREPITVNI